MTINSETKFELSKLVLDLFDAIVFFTDLSPNFIILDIVGNKLYENLNYHKEELINASFLKLIHPRDIEAFKNYISNKYEKTSKQFRIKDNNQIFKQFRVKTDHFSYNLGGESLVFLVSFGETSSELELKLFDAEERLKKLVELVPEIRYWQFLQPNEYINVIEKKRKIFENVIDYLPQYLFWKDIKLNYMGSNQKFSRMLGLLNPEGIIGKTDNDFEWAVINFDMINLNERKVLKEKIPQYRKIEAWTLPSGELVNYEVNRIPLLNMKGRLVGLLSTYEDITKQLEIERIGKASERKYKSMIKNLDIGFIKTDLDGVILDHNPALSKILGYPADQNLIGYSALDFWENSNDVMEFYNELVKSEVLKTYISRGRSVDGKVLILESNSHLVRDDENNIIGIESTISDITDKYSLEKKLKESEEKYRVITENSSDLIRVLDENMKIEYLNELAHLNLLGYSYEDLIGKKASILLHPEELEEVAALVNTTLTEGFVTREGRYRKKDGSWKWFEISLSMFTDNKGVRKMLTIGRDITFRKMLERKMTEERFQQIFETVPDIFFLVDNESRIIDYKAKVEDLFLPPEEFLGRRISGLLPPDLGVSTYTLIQKTLNNKSSHVLQYSLPIKGQTRYYEARFIYFSAEQVAIFIQDITTERLAELKLKESEQQLRKQNEELRKLDTLKTNFLTITAHALKTPLSSIYGYTDYILTKYNNLDTEMREDLETVKKNVERLTSYIEQLSDAMKIDANKMNLDLEVVNINEIITEALDQLNYLIIKKSHHIKINLDGNITLHGDKLRLTQLFSNLLSNAIKYTNEGGYIEIRSEIKETEVRFEIEDNGIGLEEEEISQLFSIFVMISKNIEKYSYFEKGSGLGLYISKGIVEAHGGTIGVNSEGKDKGTCFYFTLPLNKD